MIYLRGKKEEVRSNNHEVKSKQMKNGRTLDDDDDAPRDESPANSIHLEALCRHQKTSPRHEEREKKTKNTMIPSFIDLRLFTHKVPNSSNHSSRFPKEKKIVRDF